MPLRTGFRILYPFAFVLTWVFAHASSFYEQPFPDTVRSASQIVRGKIGKSETRWVTFPDGGKRLFTYYEVEVSEGLKGKAKTGPIHIRELGGEKDGVSLQISGAAHFSSGEDVVVMLGDEIEGENTYPLSGMMMGKYNLEKGPDGKEYLRGSGLGSSVHPRLRKEGDPALKELQVTLEGLREIVRTQAAEARQTNVPSVKTVSEKGDSLLSSKGKITSAPHEERMESDLPINPKKSEIPIRPIYVVIGGAAGIYWFLKSKKKKR